MICASITAEERVVEECDHTFVGIASLAKVAQSGLQDRARAPSKEWGEAEEYQAPGLSH